MAITETLRGRSFLRWPSVRSITPDEYDARAAERSGRPDPELVRYQQAFFELLGMVTSDTDIAGHFSTPDSNVRAPFYDMARAQIMIPDGEDALDEYRSLVLVGELTRALTHQHHPLVVANLLPLGAADAERVVAGRALLEGEAILVQTLYLESLSPERRWLVSEQGKAGTGSVLDGAPQLLRETARFPSMAGSFLAIDLYRMGGLAALDQALARPPDTTEQVLHVDRYRVLESAVEVDAFNLVAEGYVVVEEGTWGERRWRGLLGHHGDAVTAAQAAEGWGGDRYQILWAQDAGELVFVVRYVADSFADESEMNTALRESIARGMEIDSSSVVGTVTEWEGADYAMLAWDVGLITWVAATDPEVGRRMVAQLGVGA